MSYRNFIEKSSTHALQQREDGKKKERKEKKNQKNRQSTGIIRKKQTFLSLSNFPNTPLSHLTSMQRRIKYPHPFPFASLRLQRQLIFTKLNRDDTGNDDARHIDIVSISNPYFGYAVWPFRDLEVGKRSNVHWSGWVCLRLRSRCRRGMLLFGGRRLFARFAVLSWL